MKLAPWLLLDLRRVEEGGDDGCRADAHGDAGLYEFRAPLIVRITVGHAYLLGSFSMKAAV